MALGFNDALAAGLRERERRQRLVNTGQMDPYQAAQANYAGLGWDAFFGSLGVKDQAAQDAGMRTRTELGDFGNAISTSDGGYMPRTRQRAVYGSLAGTGDFDADTINQIDRQQGFDQRVMDARFGTLALEQAQRQAQMEKDAMRQADVDRQAQDYERFKVESAFTPPIDQALVRTPGAPGRGDTFSTRPAGPPQNPRAVLEQQLSRLPPNHPVRMQLEKQIAAFDAQDAAAKTAKTKADAELEKAKTANAPPPDIVAGSPQFKTAQDLAYGKMTFPQFRTLVAYGRDPNIKMGIYAKAAELNPDFNPADFERGFKFMSNPKVAQQLASLDNVASGVSDLLRVSDEAQRSGVTALNKFTNPVQIAIGNKQFTNLHTAQTAFADELSGALGYGSATDMSREMGFNMTDPNLSPENFRAAIQDIVVPFVERKRASMLKQGSIYGKPDNNSAVAPAGGAASGPKVGDVVSIGGKRIKISAIHPDGTFDGAEVK